MKAELATWAMSTVFCLAFLSLPALGILKG